MIHAEFWISCFSCWEEKVMVENVPSTKKLPKTKAQAWEAAKSVGWKGTRYKSICPTCHKEKK